MKTNTGNGVVLKGTFSVGLYVLGQIWLMNKNTSEPGRENLRKYV